MGGSCPSDDGPVRTAAAAAIGTREAGYRELLEVLLDRLRHLPAREGRPDPLSGPRLPGTPSEGGGGDRYLRERLEALRAKSKEEMKGIPRSEWNTPEDSAK